MSDGEDPPPPPPPPPPPVKLESTHPFYLGGQDQPGNLITSVRLKLDNYDAWAHAIRIAFRARRKFGFLDGTITTVESPATLDDWVAVQSTLVAWLTNTIDAKVLELLPNYENPKDLWDDLQEKFGHVHGPRIQQLQAEIQNCVQSASTPVTVYYGRLSTLWDELSKLEPLINCKCGKCTCNVGTQHSDRRDHDRFQRFLLGLHTEYYGTLRSQLLTREKLPTLNQAFQAVCAEEQLRGYCQKLVEDPAPISGFAVRAQSGRSSLPSSQPNTTPSSPRRLSRADKARIQCTECLEYGYSASTCFNVLGVQDWYVERYGRLPAKFRSSPSSAGSSVLGKGPVLKPPASTSKPSAPPKARSSVRANNTTTTPEPSYTAAQWQAMMTAFQSSNRFNGPTYEDGDWEG